MFRGIGLKKIRKGGGMKSLSAKTFNWLVNFFETLEIHGGHLETTATGEGCQLTIDAYSQGEEVGGWCQWQVRIRNNRVWVRSGNLAWGGGHSATWPQGRTVRRTLEQNIGALPEATGRYYVMWFTKVAGCPLCHCPKAPAGGNACKGEEVEECCPAPDGNPCEWNPDKGEVGIFESPDRQEGWTDCRILATVEIEEDSVTVNQIQTAEITVRAIVYPDEEVEESGEEPEEDIDDECDGAGGKFPSSVDDTIFPSEPDEEFFDDDAEGDFPSKVAACW